MNRERVKLDQCLFGYDDGHRLLASSMPLGLEASALTELSDLALGAVFGASASYWTGLPVPGIGRYALMRTWPALEMSRPGCVWTHALLIDPRALERVGDLSVLRAGFVRPKSGADQARYREPISAVVERGEEPAGGSAMSQDMVESLIGSLYGSRPVAVEIGEPGELDDALFRVWSQQWPRLRRNFRFQTAATREPRSSSAMRFDVTALLTDMSVQIRLPVSTDLPWLVAAADDARRGTGGELRRFLWSYGTDVRRQRGSFRPLVEIKLLHDTASPGTGSTLLRIITEAFPDPDDALRLKQELIDGVLVPGAQLDVLWYVLAHGGGVVFPLPTVEGVSRLALLWPERPDDLLHLAERTADAHDALGRSVFETVTGAVPSEAFWALTGSFPRVRERMIEARPELLSVDGVLDLDNANLAHLLGLIPGDAQVAGRLLPRLLVRDDERLAGVAFSRFPDSAASQVVAAADGGISKVGRAWLRELVRRPLVLLNPKIMGKITRTSFLYELGEALGWLTSDVAAAGTEPWIAALADVTWDLSDDRRDVLRAFLVALALTAGGDGGRQMLEKFFEAVHEQELRSRLAWRARDILLPLLPDVGWGRGWDYGLRLRLAVAATYVRNGYPTESYAALANGRKTRAMMSSAAADIPGGKPYAKAAHV